MVTRSKVLSLLPAYRGSAVLVVENQSTNDIMYGIFDAHEDCKRSYDRICNLFLAENLTSIGKNIFDFLKANVDYKVESLEAQTLRDPQAIIATGKTIGADCKNYALFSAGILDALNREGYAINWCYRFAGYKYGKRDLGHVFVVINPQTDKEIWIDPVASYYTERKQPTYFVDKKLAKEKLSDMALYRLSGFDEAQNRYTNVYDFINVRSNWGKLYTPVNPNGLISESALSHAILMQALQSQADRDIKAGMSETSDRYKRYDTALGNLYKKIDEFEKGLSNLGEEITETNSVKASMAGGLIDLVVGGEKWNNLKDYIAKGCLSYLYLYIPVCPYDPTGGAGVQVNGHWSGAPNGVTNAMSLYAPSVVWDKKIKQYHTSWDWGSWGSLSVEKQVYPYLYACICAQLGQTPESFWNAFFKKAYDKAPTRFKQQVNITPQDNGVFSGLGVAGSLANYLTTDIKNMASSSLSGVTSWIQQAQNSGNILGTITKTITGFLTKIKFTNDPNTFTPSASDWSDYDSLGLNPFANGFPPKAGMWSGFDNTGGGSVIDEIDPHNPTPQKDNTLLYLGAAAALGFFLLKKHK